MNVTDAQHWKPVFVRTKRDGRQATWSTAVVVLANRLIHDLDELDGVSGDLGVYNPLRLVIGCADRQPRSCVTPVPRLYMGSMNSEKKLRFSAKDILRMEVAPALGCTEPAAVALSTAVAATLMDRQFDSIELWLDPRTYKNGLAVSIPGTDGQVGIAMAAALGALGGDPEARLQVLEPITVDVVQAAVELVERGGVEVHVLQAGDGIYVRAKIRRGPEEAEVTIEGLHDNITSVARNGRAVSKSQAVPSTQAGDRREMDAMEAWLVDLRLEDLVDLLNTLDAEDLEFLAKGLEYNQRLADYGLVHGPGLGVGATFQRLVREGLIRDDMLLTARMLTSAAADARMSGVKMPAMSSAGSGNHGLTAILPIQAVRNHLENVDEVTLLKAIALSHMVTAYVKAHTGRLSAVCGCSIAAGAGATAGITYLMGGNTRHIAGAIKNLLADLAGVICDGAKAGCALKLFTAAGVAVQSALFALHGLDVKATDGIIATSPEQTMKNVSRLSTEGMLETDRTILQIMINKQLRSG
jgi:L-cysteine desulfidase